MSKFFYSIRAKIIGIIMLTSTVSAAMMFSGAVYFGFNASEEVLKHQIQAMTDLLAQNSVAAVIFEDQQALTQILATLETVPSVTFAKIEKHNGDTMAFYRPAELGHQDTKLEKQTIPSFFKSQFTTIGKVMAEGRLLAKVIIVSDRTSIIPMAILYTSLAIALLCSILLMTYLLAQRLHRGISAPIADMKHAMDQVISNDIKPRSIANTRQDEIGDVLQSFNDMLATISDQDKMLRKKADELVELVTSQDEQLSEEETKRIDWLQNLARFLQHELKNTLLGFRYSLDFIENHTEGRQVQKYIDRARESTVFMGKLLHNVGETSSLEAALLDEDTELVEVYSVCKNWLDRHTHSTGNTSFELTGKPNSYIKGNIHRLEQLLEKLVANAETYCLAESKIQVIVQAFDDEVVLSVANQGDRLPENKNMIFELFVSMRAPEHKGNAHSGLGLYVVKLIAEAYSGYVEAIDMNDQEGAIFEVHFPRVAIEE